MLILFHGIHGFCQESTVVSGYVTDQETGEFLVNATVYDAITLKGTLSNKYGYFTLLVNPKDSATIAFSYVGYKGFQITVGAQKDTLVDATLEKGIEIEAVNVNAFKINTGLNSVETGIIQMDARLAEKLPSLFGEHDVLKVLQLMPGVQGGKEGTGGLYVRGGSSDQNLILLDGMPVFNANHLGGFVSVFNPASINYMKLCKSGFPAAFGGRLSSILDIQMKNGNRKEKSGGYTFGTLTGSYFYEAPIRKDTSSFIISCRRTVYDLVLSAYNFLSTEGQSNGGYSIWDVNLKYNRKLNNERRLYFSFYKGRDILYRKNAILSADENAKSTSKYRNYWGNSIASLRLNKRYNSKTSVDYIWGLSKYEYVIRNEVKNKENYLTGKIQREFLSDMSQWIFKANFESIINSTHHFSYGVNSALHWFNPVRNEYSIIENQYAITDSVWGSKQISTPEISLYFSDQININEKVKLDAGLRLTNFRIEEKYRILPEPRINLNYRFSNNAALKFSYARMSQLVHLVSANGQALPADFWFPSTADIGPEFSSQWSLGMLHVFQKQQIYKLTFDLYYKRMTNLLEQKTAGVFLGESNIWQQQIVSGGIGKAYGAEILLEKTRGKTTGWLAYTISKNERRFADLNNGNWYPFHYDRRHELTLVFKHQLNKRLDFNAVWLYKSGEALSLPSSKYLINVQQFGAEDFAFDTYAEAYYSQSKNDFRAPAYHRLDININRTRERGNGKVIWTVGLYNAYNSANAFYYYLARNNQGEIKLHALTLFPVMPAISYSYRF
ncbi:MAG: TonB-dependent receptor [Bacteroidales bacterium]|nr:TonB-dependent receptor [Bacteroidales bacterium]